MATTLITGGTGMIGTQLTKSLLAKGYKVIILTRHASRSTTAGLTYAEWDIKKQVISRHAVQQANTIIHLAGAGVAEKRWTTERKQEIIESRVQSSSLLIKALREIPNHVTALISASAIGWYGEDATIPNPHPFTEESPAAKDFLGQTCKAWEESITPIEDLGIRLVKLRTGIVLSKSGGALEEFKKPLKWGLATVLANGKQVMSWIHIDDLVRVYEFAMENNLRNVYNAVAPHPVTNRELVMELRRVAAQRIGIPVKIPAWILKMALGEMSIEVLKSATVSNAKLEAAGFHFNRPSIKDAMKDIV